VCPRISADIAAAADKISATRQGLAKQMQPKPREATASPPTPADDLSRLYAAHRAGLARANVKIVDESVADYMIGCRLKATGHSRAEIEQALNASPGIDGRKRNVHDYIRRTLDKIEGPRGAADIAHLAKYHPQWRAMEKRALTPNPPKDTPGTKISGAKPGPKSPPAARRRQNEGSEL
jgi:hypothetical protein